MPEEELIIIIIIIIIIMEFSIEKCAMLIMKHGHRQIMERMELPSEERIRMLAEKENYK